MIDLFLTSTQYFTSQYVNWWTGVMWITCGLLWCFYQLFGLSFDGTIHAEDPLLSKWGNAKFLQIYSDEENKLIYILDGLSIWLHFYFLTITSTLYLSEYLW